MSTLFSLEALRAKAGDCLLLHVGTAESRRVVLIDGGPSGVWKEVLRPRLDALRADPAYGADDGPLPMPLVVVSHVDDDHINGVIELFEKVDDTSESLAFVGGLWHNGLHALTSNEIIDETLEADPPAETAAVLASYPQGERLEVLANAIPVPINEQFDGLVVAPPPGAAVPHVDDMTLRVVAPDADRLQALLDDWRKDLERRRKDRDLRPASFDDDSIPNLSSIVILAECGGKRVLLTGDARGDYLVESLERAGLEFTFDEPLDVLKVPHHGSARNMTVETFAATPARHYVISADGKHGNPDLELLRMLLEAREGHDDFTLHFTNAAMTEKLDDGTTRDVGEEVRALLSEAQQTRGFEVEFCDDAAPSLVIDLLEDPLG
jgi:hypothetical protein